MQVAACLSELSPKIRLRAAPLVTPGDDFASSGIEVVTRGCRLPTGGFSFTSVAGFLTDAPHCPAYARYLLQLRRVRHNTDWALVVGDIILLLMAVVGLRRPVAYVALAKSDYKGPHHALEIEAMRRYATRIFTRDAVTAESLRAHGVNAVYLGNPMMDGLPRMRTTDMREPVLGLLPGSRKEAYQNMKRLLAVAELIPEKPRGICAIPSCLDVNKFRRVARSAGWTCSNGTIAKSGVEILLAVDRFDEVATDSSVILGIAGTANEQAAGMGKPVISVPGFGPQTTTRRMLKQERLMGGAVKFARRGIHQAAKEIAYLLSHPEEAERRGWIGRARMGPPGASGRIAYSLMQLFGMSCVRSKVGQAVNIGVEPIGE